ncbi:MAG: hypothetical protein NVV60_10085 [Luteimonas sp.]|nr:hypothetical protein [Luteimonas sp.]
MIAITAKTSCTARRIATVLAVCVGMACLPTTVLAQEARRLSAFLSGNASQEAPKEEAQDEAAQTSPRASRLSSFLSGGSGQQREALSFESLSDGRLKHAQEAHAAEQRRLAAIEAERRRVEEAAWRAEQEALAAEQRIRDLEWEQERAEREYEEREYARRSRSSGPDPLAMAILGVARNIGTVAAQNVMADHYREQAASRQRLADSAARREAEEQRLRAGERAAQARRDAEAANARARQQAAQARQDADAANARARQQVAQSGQDAAAASAHANRAATQQSAEADFRRREAAASSRPTTLSGFLSGGGTTAAASGGAAGSAGGQGSRGAGGVASTASAASSSQSDFYRPDPLLQECMRLEMTKKVGWDDAERAAANAFNAGVDERKKALGCPVHSQSGQAREL